MRRTSLFWQLFSTFLLITFTALAGVGWYALNSLRHFYLERTADDLESRAHLIRIQIVNSLGKPVGLQRLCGQLGKSSGTRITVVKENGKVLCDSEKDPERMENHGNRPEIQSALKGSVGYSIRFSNTLKENFLYVGIPFQKEDQSSGVIRTSVPLRLIEPANGSIRYQVASVGFLVAFLVAAVSWYVSRRISRPLVEIKKGAEHFARGDLTFQVPVTQSFEIGGLAESLNQMAKQLNETIGTITTQRNEREAILSSMTEGVLAIDGKERLISLNQAGAKLLDMNLETGKGRYLSEMIRNPGLEEIVKQVLSEQAIIDNEIRIGHKNQRFVRVQGAGLCDAQAKRIGAVLVFNDVTQLRKLERTRRDFVANVSHELKTPITSIKGFIETLVAGALQEPENALRFLGIMGKQVDRLNEIIDDLLSLSRIEQESETSQVQMESVNVLTILRLAIQSCQQSADENNIKIHMNCQDDLILKANPHLMEQAVVNLVQNAIKYSNQENKILVNVSLKFSNVIISVQDWGCGIAKEHLPRLFERFYRADKARSRKLGGTGLGLAIVKHIAQAHGGSVSVDSIPLKGSIFSIHIPSS